MKQQKDHGKSTKNKLLTRQFTYTEKEDINKQDPAHCYYQDHVQNASLDNRIVFRAWQHFRCPHREDVPDGNAD